MTAAADLVVAHGGTLSGEHGDGRARSELLPRMFSPELIRTFGIWKAIWDEAGVLNPGIVVDPLPFTADLRSPRPTLISLDPAFAHAADGGDLRQAVERCIGVGRCVSRQGAALMCPSYRATGEERHSTRGRSRLLQEMVAGHARRRGLALDGGARRARPVPVVPGVRNRMPDGRGHGDLQVGVPRSSLSGPAAAAVALFAGLAADLAAARPPGSRRGTRGQRAHRVCTGAPPVRVAGRDGRRAAHPPDRAADVRRFVPGLVVGWIGRSIDRGGRPRPGGPVAGHVQQSPHARGRAGRRPCARRRRVRRVRSLDAGLLRAHLDHHRPAGPGAIRAPGNRCGAGARRGRADRRPRAVVRGDAPAGPGRAAPRRCPRRIDRGAGDDLRGDPRPRRLRGPGRANR